MVATSYSSLCSNESPHKSRVRRYGILPVRDRSRQYGQQGSQGQFNKQPALHIDLNLVILGTRAYLLTLFFLDSPIGSELARVAQAIFCPPWHACLISPLWSPSAMTITAFEASIATSPHLLKHNRHESIQGIKPDFVCLKSLAFSRFTILIQSGSSKDISDCESNFGYVSLARPSR